MKLVIDTNVVISAILRDRDPERVLVTGDHDFNEAKKLMKTTIISVSSFKRLVIDPVSVSP